MLFRKAREDDLPAIHYLAENSGIGITTLPQNQELLKKRLEWSTSSFNKSVESPLNEYYLFVLEDPENGKVVGTSAIEAAVGHDTPFYSYKVSQRTSICKELNIHNHHEILSLVNDYDGHSEICTLFLDPSYRHNSNGLLLSRARFLFMAQYPDRFAPKVIADMRGISDEEGRSPFWDHVGYHFFQMPFSEADRLTLSTNKQFIADLMPQNPIYVKLLDPAAQAVIGKPHRCGVAAFNILLREGFRYTKYIDIFDAGPTIEAPREHIHTVAASRLLTISAISDDINSERFITSNTKLDYRAIVSRVGINGHEKSCILSHHTAQMLQVKCGDCIRIAPLQRESE